MNSINYIDSIESIKSVESFKRQIAKRSGNFLALSAVPALKVRIGFLGKLGDTEVVWDATVQTLASFLQENPDNSEALTLEPGKPKSFIQVAVPQNGISQLNIVLPVPIIDEPTIKKTIIMIRCYKRLQVGRHEFGGNL